ncbi:hypothetical protein [Salsipaludibacter albus]|uniref:hypothetical protein n=1 Tax=Salsipaludibacter albus TaxID=2849650 RepID=UPI001EE45A28|nr:hypothetical protein [Salsipaludibacter albus]MBY5162051.1 hypothetical protein [Salsipaludibacter albus]
MAPEQATRSPHVGTLGEGSLHRALKRWYARPGDRVEVAVDGFVADLVRGDTLVEIQTSGFSSMGRKFDHLLDHHDVRLVHPIPVDTTIVKVGDGGEVLSRRLSPKHGTPAHVFAELVSFPNLLDHPNLTLEVVMTREDQVRTHDPDRAWRRRGWVVEERRLVEVVDHLVFDTPADLLDLLPDDLPVDFTTADLAGGLGSRRRLAQQMAYCLRHLGLVRMVDRRGNTIVYRRTP